MNETDLVVQDLLVEPSDDTYIEESDNGSRGRGRHAVKEATVRTARTQTVAQQQLLLMVQKMQVLKK